MNPRVSFSLLDWFGLDNDLSVMGEFNRVPNQIYQYLPQSTGVAAQIRGEVRMDQTCNFKALFVGTLC